MKKISLLTLMIILSACSPNSTKQNFDDKLKAEFASEIILQKINDNGEHLLCDQPNYQKCFQISQQECIDESIQFKVVCLEKSNDMVKDISNATDASNFGQAYAMCMMTKQLMIHSSKINEISSCMKDAKFEKDLASKSIFK